jgi:hypothetical protein
MNDDIDAPHKKEYEAPTGTPIEWMVKNLIGSGYLPMIEGGHATWSVFSNVPVAIVAQEWLDPQMFFLPSTDKLDFRNGNLWIYVNYHAQIKPDIVYGIFQGLRFRAG